MAGSERLENVNPTIHGRLKERFITPEEEDDNVVDKIDAREVFDALISLRTLEYCPQSELDSRIKASLKQDLIRNINDPEHPLTLEELNVVEHAQVDVDDDANSVRILFTPTIPHCSMATLIGLSIRVKLLRALPSRFKVDVEITPGSHVSEHAVNKQLADKERVAAALENSHLLEVVNQCLSMRN